MSGFFAWLKDILFDTSRKEYLRRCREADELDEKIWQARVNKHIEKHGPSEAKNKPLKRYRETPPW